MASSSRFAPRCGHPDTDLGAAHHGEELFVEREVFGLDGDEDLLGDVGRRRVGVELLDDAGDERGRLDVFDLVDDETLAAHDPAPADVEDLHRRLELVLRDPEQVVVLFAGTHHLLAFDRLAHRGELVAAPRRELELGLVGGGAHRRSSRATTASDSPSRKSTSSWTSTLYSSGVTSPTHGAAHFSMCA